MVLLAHAQEAAKTHNCKHNMVGELIEDDILDLSDLLPSRVLDTRAKNRLRANRVRFCSAHSHDSGPPNVNQPCKPKRLMLRRLRAHRPASEPHRDTADNPAT